jgi:hypothetical protein
VSSAGQLYVLLKQQGLYLLQSFIIIRFVAYLLSLGLWWRGGGRGWLARVGIHTGKRRGVSFTFALFPTALLMELTLLTFLFLFFISIMLAM